ncbi:hypothetical protein AA0312_2821 [Acetobacter tropicalis NRIC 0312]|uniref:Uncharacterized protein n=1 Tax=Acetobacter tropicalis TaxID=104102 RepID=A0A511FSU8_9PROT|nr:hypothetical protein [Acetobacter tropicalis]KXV53311.1 hypothetical protein AD944_00585 [Acetobacter tropicalis]GAL96246.1 hypothetical protein ATR1_028d0002 [Acetobacter tropicalis]GBR72224.1 hypothetical protein AA0312_2821 [Acetobacter tropicalis NRIC 0312]GEL51955.1 hypothetical protein ATR01nite_30300 [Acetobacter tropicalis]
MSDYTTISSAVEADLMQLVALHRLLDFALSQSLEGNTDDRILEGVVILTRMVGRKVRRLADKLLDGQGFGCD